MIYDRTPWIPYSPVDSAGGAAWKEIQAANTEGKPTPGLQLTYFKKPRPVYEFYDLDADVSELENLSGRPEVAAVEREHRLALAERMILDFDYLPLPDVMEPTAGAGGKKAKATSNGKK
ncbi:MAG: hypothetical protein KDA89_09735 [Planctomycetaceae bacterium]|nr:hypothetical protein [Planctomycetaceae bacterium]